MKVKQKKCKGTGQATGFGCGELKDIFRYGLCISCYPKWLYNTPEGLLKIERATIKAKAPRLELEQLVKEDKERKSIGTLLKQLEKVCHEYIRLRDKYKPCISCGAPWQHNFQAGHFYKAELFPSIRFNEFNISGQCTQCNLRKDGNWSGYSLNLPIIIGQDKYEELAFLANQEKKTDFKWDRSEIKELITYYRSKLKELK